MKPGNSSSLTTSIVPGCRSSWLSRTSTPQLASWRSRALCCSTRDGNATAPWRSPSRASWANSAPWQELSRKRDLGYLAELRGDGFCDSHRLRQGRLGPLTFVRIDRYCDRGRPGAEDHEGTMVLV